METLFFLMFPLVFVGFIFLLIYAIHANKKRAEELERRASAMQLNFSRTAPAGFAEELAKMSFFSDPANRSYFNVMSGQAGGMSIHIFEYHVGQESSAAGTTAVVHAGADGPAMTQTHTASSGTSSQYAAVCLRGMPPLPQFLLYPSTFLDGIAKKLFGMQDINFDSNPLFSKEWVLQGYKEAAVRNLFSAQTLSYCETLPKDTIIGEGERLVLLRRGFLMPEQVEGLLKDALALNDVLRKNAG